LDFPGRAAGVGHVLVAVGDVEEVEGVDGHAGACGLGGWPSISTNSGEAPASAFTGGVRRLSRLQGVAPISLGNCSGSHEL
jgi:hypothetical protein